MALSGPNLWNSTHRAVNYNYSFTPYAFAVVNDDGSGNAEIVVGSAWILFQVDQRVFIDSGIYAGNWVVTATDTNVITINTSYIGTDAASIKPLLNMSGAIWAGYQSGHAGYSIYPFRQIATFEAIPGLTGDITLDVSGYLKSVFKDIVAPILGHDFAMSVPFRIVATDPILGGALPQVTYYALNGTFDQTILQNYDDNFAVLNAREPITFENGTWIYSMIWPDTTQHGEHIFNVMGIHGTGNPGGLGFDAIGTTFTVG